MAFDRAVKDGKLQYLSASAIDMADEKNPGGCLRKWWFRYVKGIKEPQSKSQIEGVRLHEQLANYLLGGPKSLETRILKGLHFVPEPGSDLLVEHDIAADGFLTSPLRIDGIPIIGKIDCTHSRGINRGAEDITDIDDPNTVEILDWKFVRNLKWMKLPSDLPRTTQMAAYATWMFTVRPEISRIRLSHGYFPESGNARKVSLPIFRENVLPQWQHAQSVARSIRDAASCTEEAQVTANTRACTAFGRPCVHREYCSAGMHSTMRDLFGTSATERLLNTVTNNTMTNNVTTQLSLFPSDSFYPTTSEELKEKMIESDAKHMFEDGCVKIEALGRGFPKLTGEAAKLMCKIKHSAPVEVFLGSGEFAQVEMSDPTLIKLYVDQLGEWSRANPREVPVAPPTPAPTPMLIEEPKAKKSKMKTAASTTTTLPSDVRVEVSSGRIDLFVDAITTVSAKRLEPVIDDVCSRLAKQFSAIDIRCAPSDGPLAYAKWKGALAAFVREVPLEPGVYVLDARGSEIAEVVADALRARVIASGGIYCRGIR